MSDVFPATDPSANRAPAAARSPGGVSFAVRRRVAVGAAIVVFAWSVVELANLLAVHTVGPELYGVLVAALAVLAGGLSLALLRSPDRRLWAAVAVLALWAVIALGGVAGMVAHIVGPSAGHGPVDVRERPVVAPLIFTVLGSIGSVALWFGQRSGARSIDDPRKE